MSGVVSLTIPVKVENPLNGAHMHWRTAAGKRKKIRKAVAAEWLTLRSKDRGALKAILAAKDRGLVITLTRLSSGSVSTGALLDDDAVAATLKSVRDQVTACLGFDDDSDPRLKFLYAQERVARGVFGVRVEIENRTAQSSARNN